MIDSEKRSLTAAQCRAGRAWLGWTQGELAAAAGVSPRAVTTFEAGRVTPQRATLAQLRRALEDAGVVFEPPGGVTLTPAA